MLHLLLALLLIVPFPTIPGLNLWFPLFELELFDEPVPQAFAVHEGTIYVLDGEGRMYITRGGRTASMLLEGGHQAGSMEIDGDDLVIFRNMIPLDEPRTILRYSKKGELIEHASLPPDPAMQRRLQLAHGDEIYVFPQTVKAGRMEGGYLIENSDGRRWLFNPGDGGVTVIPGYPLSAEQNRLEFYHRGSPLIVNTTGTAVNIRWLGQDQQGREYWSFTDFYDHHNQRHIIVRIGKRGTTYADITPRTDSRLNTWVSLDTMTGHIYTANTSDGVYTIHRLNSLRYTRSYPAWSSQPAADWYNSATDSIMARQLWAAQVTGAKEYLWQQHRRSTNYNGITRSQVWETALSYVNYQWILNMEANGANPVNEVVGMLPRWIGHKEDGSVIRGLPYCWGGSVTLEKFDHHLSLGWQAGNIEPKGGWKRETTGVDCSGLVWNCYGYPTRPGGGRTSITSPHHWTRIPNNQLVWMDMVRKPGHVALFVAREPNNPDMFYTIEATGAQANDRVMMWYRYFSEGFQGLRYNGLYRNPTEHIPQACTGGQVYVVHRENEEVISRVLADGVLRRTRTLETWECSICRQHWIRQTRLSTEYR